MQDAVHQTYTDIRKTLPPAAPLVVLHIGEVQTWVAAGMGTEPNRVQVLEIGSLRTSNDFFKHNPPLPYELEAAIMVVEDQLATVREMALGGASLHSTDDGVFQLARMAGYTDEVATHLPIEQVERLFDQLAARSEGRISSQVNLPDDPRFSATLLILREFMHHLRFCDIHLSGHQR